MEFRVETRKRQELVDITARVAAIVRKSGVKDGFCHVFVPHATAAVIINENDDPALCDDLLDALNRAFPDRAGYRHDRVDGNAGAHIKAAVLGPSETVPVENGGLALGRWQAIMLAELDGPRERRIIVTVLDTVIENSE
jgi:secondary thiamine-phosphate synthase enzyme